MMMVSYSLSQALHGLLLLLPFAAGQGQSPKSSGTNFRYMTEATKKYQVKSMPEVNYDIGEMYAGNVPIGTNQSETLYFVFQPKLGDPVDEVTIWLNGGPGCSSLEGFFQENGRFVWAWGLHEPMENLYSWVNLTNVLWVDQPISTGFSQGTASAKNEVDSAEQFLAFFKNFQDIFGIKNYKIYVTGESYAGRYVPYISAQMIEANDVEYFDLAGALMYDPSIGDADVQGNTPTVQFVRNNWRYLGLNSTFIEYLEELDATCGYTDYIDEYLTFPPIGTQPTYSNQGGCDTGTLAQDALLRVNPCWNPYWTIQQCPLIYDPLGFPTYLEYIPPGDTIYFQRADVVKAMNAPTDITWTECGGNPFPDGDGSSDPILDVLPKVIEHTNRTLIGNGDLDAVIFTNGTLLSIQNMTWNGQLGFSQKPTAELVIDLVDLQYAAVFIENGIEGLDGAQGVVGIQHYERGLMWVETFESGHMQPQFQPRASYRHLEWLLGRIESF